MRVLVVSLLAGCCALMACNKGPTKPESMVLVKDGALKTQPWTGLPAGAQARDVVWDGRIRLLGTRVEPPAGNPGDRVVITSWYLLEKDLLEDWKLFLHVGAQGGELTVLQDDHDPLGGLMTTSRWRPGEVLEDARPLVLPSPTPAGELQIMAGFYRDRTRLPVDKASDHSGDNRVLLASIPVGGAKAFPEYSAPKRVGPISLDGMALEPDWEKAPRAGPFINYDGHGVPSNKTFARLLWDEEALYILFECEDRDIWTSFTKRDDPIYNEEAVEIFLDVDGDTTLAGTGNYQELQAAPNDVHFDASFTGRRKGMNAGWNSAYETRASLRGTFNNPGDVDEGWNSEWRIPWEDMTDNNGAVQAGKRLKFNLFRLDKPRQNGRIVGNEASAWSSPLSGDFHNIARFGTLILAP